MPIRYNGQDNRLVCGNTLIKSVIVGGQTCVYGENIQDKYIYTYSIENDTVTITGLTDYGKTLSKLSIPESIEGKSVTSIKGELISSVADSLYIPSTIKSMHGSFSTFTNNPFKLAQLSSVVVDIDNPTYHSAGNCVIETATKKLITGCKTSVIPDDDSVTSIGDGAFFECEGLTSITIPDSVTSIRYESFRGCSGLTSVTIDNGVTIIGMYAFADCTALTSVDIGNGVTSIGWAAFSRCLSLASIIIPDSVTNIDYYAFEACVELMSVTFTGTMMQWRAITKGEDWNRGCPFTKVECSDGTISV